MNWQEWCEIIYFGVAAVVCVITWVDNSTVYYVNSDPPSGITAGLLWPIWALIGIICWVSRSDGQT